MAIKQYSLCALFSVVSAKMCTENEINNLFFFYLRRRRTCFTTAKVIRSVLRYAEQRERMQSGGNEKINSTTCGHNNTSLCTFWNGFDKGSIFFLSFVIAVIVMESIISL